MRFKTAIRKLQEDPYRGLELNYNGVFVGWVITDAMMRQLCEEAGRVPIVRPVT